LQLQPDDLQKYVLLSALLNRNVRLFYKVLSEHLEELMPIVYTPTVGAAVQRFSRVFQGGGGVWITPDMQGRMQDVLRSVVGTKEVRLLVVTDNESILGLGDQGAGGMAISVGKLALYTAAAGIDPAQALPVSLDFGTDNDELLADDQYLGWPARRLRGDAYLELVDEFVTAVQAVMPRALVQWEDFRKDNALTILDRYADRLPSFNDDIQGTGAVVMAGLNSALKIKNEALAAQRIVIFGAGAAGLGVARQIKAQLTESGVAPEAQAALVAVLDRNGLIVDDGRLLDAYKRELAWSPELALAHGFSEPRTRLLHDVVRLYRPTMLIGVSGVAGAFDEPLVREMAANVRQPVIFPSSNPSASSEATPADLYAWSDCRCLVATGSPFGDVRCGGRSFRVGQGNNVFIFPRSRPWGVGRECAQSDQRHDQRRLESARCAGDGRGACAGPVVPGSYAATRGFVRDRSCGCAAGRSRRRRRHCRGRDRAACPAGDLGAGLPRLRARLRFSSRRLGSRRRIRAQAIRRVALRGW
jgi:malic enzyme